MKTKLLSIAMMVALILAAITRGQAQEYDGPCLPPTHGLDDHQSAFCGSTLTQTIALSAGVNWFSTYVEIALDDLKAALVEALPNTAITIKGVNNSTKFTRGHWQGDLTWNVEEMYKITVANDCSFNLEGMPLDPSAHPVTIAGGGTATWLGFPLNQSMTPTNAFAGFAQNSDKLKSENAATQYTRGHWNGEFPLEPGKGYVYISAPNSTDRVLTFPSSNK
jgi:hypothetical protein